MTPRIPPRSRRGVLRAVLLTSLLAGMTARAEEEVESLTLAFGWRAGIDARAETFKGRRRIVDGTVQEESELRVAYQLRTRYGNLARLRVVHEGLAVAAGDAVPPEIALKELAQLTPLAPDFEIDGAGGFLSIVDRGTAADRLSRALGVLVGPGGSTPPNAARVLDSLSSEGMLTARASDRWSTLIGAWAGRTLEVGNFFESRGAAPHPALPSASVPMSYLFGIESRTGCSDPEGPPDCVLLRLVTTLEAEDMREATRTIIERIDASRLPAGFAETEIASRTDVTVIADPETLLPYYFEHRRTIEVTGPGGMQEQEEYERTIYHHGER